MIAWGNLAANSLWLSGCALALAALSYASWWASCAGASWRRGLARPGIQRTLQIAGVLVCAGQAATASSTLAQGIWICLGGVFLLLFGLVSKKGKKSIFTS